MKYVLIENPVCNPVNGGCDHQACTSFHFSLCNWRALTVNSNLLEFLSFNALETQWNSLNHRELLKTASWNNSLCQRHTTDFAHCQIYEVNARSPEHQQLARRIVAESVAWHFAPAVVRSWKNICSPKMARARRSNPSLVWDQGDSSQERAPWLWYTLIKPSWQLTKLWKLPILPKFSAFKRRKLPGKRCNYA